MHRETIDAYDAGAQHWLTTRYQGSGPSPAAERFRQLVGHGLILDLGCGPGQLLGELGEPSIGVDASIGMLTLASGATAAPLAQADAEALPFADGVVAGVFANFSLQHLPRPAFRVALQQIRRVLRAGGHLEVTMHNGDAPHLQQQPDGVRSDDDIAGGRWFTYWTAAEAVAALDEAGFAVLEVENLGYANRFLARNP